MIKTIEELKKTGKFCVNCKHYQHVGYQTKYNVGKPHECAREFTHVVIDLVTGAHYYIETKNCEEERSQHSKYCGSEGRFFEPK